MFKKNIYFYIAIICFAFISNCFAGSDLPYKEGELLVRFSQKADGSQRTTAERDNILAAIQGATVRKTSKFVPALTLVKLPPGLTVKDALKIFNNKEGILHAQPNYLYQALSEPNDTRFSELWGLHNTGQTGGTLDADIDAPEAWDIIHDACDIIVAVLDTGVDYTHPDLAPNMWTDANGHHGYDFINDGDDPNDDNFHGTHVAGIIGADGNNGTGVTGVCWNVKIMALKIANSSGGINTFDAREAVDYAVSNGAKILNNSWGGGPNSYDQELKNAIEAANAAGVLFIAAAGNSGTNNDGSYHVYPASYDCSNIIAVMATDAYDKRSLWPEYGESSNWGPTTVDLAAPGSYILSTFPTERTDGMDYYEYYYGIRFSTDYETISGTSMAAPYVAGACALLWSYRPYLTHNEVKEGILESVDILPWLENDPAWGRLCQTGGRLNLHKALDYKPHRFSLVMDNNDPNNGCVDPNLHKNLTFDIYWNTNGYPDTNMAVLDHLPYELDYNSFSSPAGDYNQLDRTVKWDIIGNSGHIVLKTNVTQWAAPGEIISNNAVMEGNNYRNRTSCQVSTCFWGSKIIYVDRDANDANGCNNGTNWKDAYKDIQDALTAARNSSGYITAIWVAAGTYKPVNDVNISGYQNKSFELPNNVALIGHFGGKGTYETSPYQRNFNDANNETILEGQIGQNYYDAVQYVVRAEGVEAGLIDGFTIKGGYKVSYEGAYEGAGIYLVGDANVSIVNCKIKDNYPQGIYDYNSSPDIHNCTFSNNSSAGTFFDLCRPEISNCIFDGNNLTTDGIYMNHCSFISVVDSTFKRHKSYGLNGLSSTLALANSSFDGGSSGLNLAVDVTTTMNGCIIERSSGSGMWLQFGCNLSLQNSVIRQCGTNGVELSENFATTIKNNWIHNNGAAGISFTTSQGQPSVPLVRNNTIYGNHTYGIQSSQQGEDPNIINCIIYGNVTDDLYRGENGSFSTVNYCLLQHSHPGDGNNITGDPCFMNPDINDLHIDVNSQCRNAGNPYINYDGETDIDGESRVAYGQVDIGGDEYYWSKADYNKDGIVDFNDFAALANKWKMQDAGISLDDDSDVDIYDLDLFCNDWLWEAGWTQGQWMMTMAGDGGAGMSAAAMESTSLLEGDVAQSQAGDTLMLLDVKASLLAQPARLRARSQKFYDITPNPTSSVSLGGMDTIADSSAETLGLADTMFATVSIEEATVAEATTEAQAMTAEGLSNIFLSVDGNDWTDLIVMGEYPGQFVVAVECNTLLEPNDISVQVENGTLEPVGDGNNIYYFQFAASGEAAVNLVTNVDMVIDGNSVPANTLIYQLWLYYNADIDIYAAFGIGLSDLILPPDDGE